MIQHLHKIKDHIQILLSVVENLIKHFQEYVFCEVCLHDILAAAIHLCGKVCMVTSNIPIHVACTWRPW